MLIPVILVTRLLNPRVPIPLVLSNYCCLVLIPRPIDFISNTILVILDIYLATLERIIVIHHKEAGRKSINLVCILQFNTTSFLPISRASLRKVTDAKGCYQP